MDLKARDKATARPRCGALTRQGRPCSQPAIGADGLCVYHSRDPGIVARRREGNRLGAETVRQMRTAALVGNLRTPQEILKRIEELLHRLASAEISPKAINAACKLIAEARETIALEAKLRREEREEERRRFRTYALAPDILERINADEPPPQPTAGLGELIEPVEGT